MESRVLQAPRKTLHLHLAKMPQLHRQLAKEAASCDVLVPKSQIHRAFSKEPLQRSSFLGCLPSLEEQLLVGPPEPPGDRQGVEMSSLCSHAQPGAFPAAQVRARFSCLSQVGHTRRQEVRPGTFTSLIRSCLLTGRLAFYS